MIPAEPLQNEAKRLEALYKYDVLDTLPEEALDDLTSTAAQVCGTPIALISLVDKHRQWFKSRVNLDITESSRDISFCAEAIRQSNLLIVPDASQDPRFADNPSVKGDPLIRFYAGAQLLSREGQPLGTLCVIDHVPRTITPTQQQLLRVLARQVMTHLELRRRTRELAFSEDQLQLVTSKARVGLVVVDRDRRYTYANTAYAEVLGLASADIVGQRVQDVLPEVYEDQVCPHADRAFAGERVDYELRRPSSEGDNHYVVHYEPIWLDGIVALAVVVITNITTHRRMEEAVRMNLERFQIVSRATNDAVWDWNLVTNSLWWNENYQKLFGYPPGETKPTLDSWTDYLHPDDKDRVLHGIYQTVEQGGRSWSDKYRFRRHDGAYATIFDRGYVIHDSAGKAVRMIGAMQDITERKQAEEQIAEQAALLDQARDAIFVRNLDGQVLFWSKGAERTYGWTREEAINRHIADVVYSDRSKFEEINRAILQAGEWSGEARHRSKQGNELIMEARYTLVRDAAGKPKSVMAINTDVTDKKKIEAQFLRAQRMESIGTLAGGIAHDLNNILAPIMMSIEILGAAAKDASTQSALDSLKTSARRGADVVRQVLSFARGVEGERIEIQPRHLLGEIQSIIRDTFPKNIQLELLFPQQPWTVLGDSTQLHQILLNLCVNARDAMPNGGLLTIAIENVVVDEQYASMQIDAKPGRYVVYRVTDAGSGILPAVLDKIFEPFFTTKGLGHGTGLGLSTVMAIVKSHAGFVSVYSEPDRGTTFKVYLPAVETASGTSPGPVAEASLPRGNGETILVIDDEASILVITGQTLEAFGYQVLTASDGPEAVTIFAEHQDKIAVVITDVSMPVMNGPAIVRALMSLKPAVKIIAASGLQTNRGGPQVFGPAVKEFLTKPYTAETLLTTIRKLLDETA